MMSQVASGSRGSTSEPASPSSTARRLARIWTIGAIAWLLVPVIALGWLIARSGSQQVEPDVAVWAPIVATEDRTTTTVGLAYDWVAAKTVLAPQWSGTVQEVNCTPGSTIESGAVVARVDNVQRIAFHSSIPFVRELRVGSKGDDVAQLHELLTTLGVDNPGGESFAYETGIAVGELAQRLGLSNTVRAFDPSWVLYLAAPQVDVARCHLVVGAPVPAFGEPVVTSSPQITRAIIITSALVETLLTDAQGAEDSQDDVNAASSAADGDRVSIQQGDTLSVAGNEIEVDTATGEVVAESLPQLAALLQSLTPASAAALSKPAPPDSWVVPTEAVFAGSSGETCVVAQGRQNAVPVSIAGYDTNGSLVVGDLEPGTRVLVAPEPEERSCE